MYNLSAGEIFALSSVPLSLTRKPTATSLIFVTELHRAAFSSVYEIFSLVCKIILAVAACGAPSVPGAAAATADQLPTLRSHFAWNGQD